MRRWRWLVGVFALVLALGAASSSVQVRQHVADAQQGEDPVLLRELAERLLTSASSGGSGSIFISESVAISAGSTRGRTPPAELPRATLLPGKLPPDLDFDVPLPPGARLLGSVAGTRISGAITTFEAVLDVPRDGENPLAFYERVLTEQGWTVAPSLLQMLLPALAGGFVEAESTGRPLLPTFEEPYRTFCRSVRGPALTVRLGAEAQTVRDVRLQGGLSAFGRCQTVEIPELDPVLRPRLVLPSNTTLQRGTGGSGRTQATVLSQQSAAELEAHFARQLEAIGWTRHDGGAQNSLAWSTWMHPNHPDGRGILEVLIEPGEQVRFLRFEVLALRSSGSGRP